MPSAFDIANLKASKNIVPQQIKSFGAVGILPMLYINPEANKRREDIVARIKRLSTKQFIAQNPLYRPINIPVINSRDTTKLADELIKASIPPEKQIKENVMNATIREKILKDCQGKILQGIVEGTFSDDYLKPLQRTLSTAGLIATFIPGVGMVLGPALGAAAAVTAVGRHLGDEYGVLPSTESNLLSQAGWEAVGAVIPLAGKALSGIAGISDKIGLQATNIAGSGKAAAALGGLEGAVEALPKVGLLGKELKFLNATPGLEWKGLNTADILRHRKAEAIANIQPLSTKVKAMRSFNTQPLVQAASGGYGPIAGNITRGGMRAIDALVRGGRYTTKAGNTFKITPLDIASQAIAKSTGSSGFDLFGLVDRVNNPLNIRPANRWQRTKKDPHRRGSNLSNFAAIQSLIPSTSN